MAAEVHRQAAENALSAGNVESAASEAHELLRLTSALGLHLRQTSALELLGRIHEHRTERTLAIGYYVYALRRARRQGYVRRENSIADRLWRLDSEALKRAHEGGKD